MVAFCRLGNQQWYTLLAISIKQHTALHSGLYLLQWPFCLLASTTICNKLHGCKERSIVDLVDFQKSPCRVFVPFWQLELAASGHCGTKWPLKGHLAARTRNTLSHDGGLQKDAPHRHNHHLLTCGQDDDVVGKWCQQLFYNILTYVGGGPGLFRRKVFQKSGFRFHNWFY